jgi:hypothetical protein
MATATAAGAALAIAAPPAQAATFEVTNLTDAAPGSLRDAVNQANAAGGADTITFQSGLSGTINVASQIDITDELDIVGPGSDVITLDGGDANRLLYSTGPGLAVSGLTFTNGDTDGASNGGAIAAYGGSFSLEDVVVSSSYADSSGGGVFAGSNDISVVDSVFTDNVADYTGGGFGSDGYSGIAPSDEFSFSGSVITGNTAASAGGGISVYDSYTPTSIDTTTISDNTVTGNGGSRNDGGGIWFEDTYDDQPTTVSNSTVTGNSAPVHGGGISFGENFYAETRVVNSTITDNEAGYGGGVSFADGEEPENFSVENSTITGNSATAAGGGIFRGYYDQSADAYLELSSSVVSDNTAPTSPDIGQSAQATGDLTVENSLIGDTSGATYTADPPGTVLTGVDPELGPLADNGGPTETRLPAETSPLIDAGLGNGLVTDQRGEDRTIDYPGVPSTLGSNGTDIGAVELAEEAPEPPPDTEVENPFLKMKNPQRQGDKKIKLKVRAGAGEDVLAKASGVIRLGHGNAVKLGKERVLAGERATLVLKPKQKGAVRRILDALAEGRKPKAEIDARLIDDAGNEHYELLTAKLKPKK